MDDRFKPRTGIERRRTCVVLHVIAKHRCVAQKSTMHQRREPVWMSSLEKDTRGINSILSPLHLHATTSAFLCENQSKFRA